MDRKRFPYRTFKLDPNSRCNRHSDSQAMRSSFPLEQAVVRTNTADVPAFNVAILYDDTPAGHRAMRMVAALNAKLSDAQLPLKPQLWRFDLLQDSEWFALALADAINADMLILSTSNAHGLPTKVESWLKLCIARKRGTNAAIVALLGPDPHLDEQASPRFRVVQGMARNANLDFFAPGLRSPAAGLEPLRRELFPVMTEAFDRMNPSPRWGINE